MGIRRKGEPLPGNLIDEKLAFGDTLLVVGAWKQIRLLQTDPKDFVVLSLPVEINEVAPARRKAPYALLSLLGMIVLMTFGLVAVLLAGLAMGLFRCVDMESAYKSINWQSLVLIASMLAALRPSLAEDRRHRSDRRRAYVQPWRSRSLRHDEWLQPCLVVHQPKIIFLLTIFFILAPAWLLC